MGLLNFFKPSNSVVVVDVISLFNALGMKGDVSPRTQLQVLRRLTRFAEREKVELIAVLSGEPLHKAPNRKKFDSILVLYSKSTEKHAGFVAKVALKRGALLLTDNLKAEKTAGASVEKMRLSTFRKAFDMSMDGDSADGGESGRGRRRRRIRRPHVEHGARGEEDVLPEKSSASEGDSDAINELIDLVD
ncbi:MAG: hypothetical protein ACJZ86_04570 [Pontiellaceae bacterium]